MSYKLTLTISGNVPQTIEVPKGRFSIGRGEDNDLVVSLAGVSRRHAVITNLDEGVQVADCDSQNGTFVNGRQVETAVELTDGVLISLGSVCEIRVGLWREDNASGHGPSSQLFLSQGSTAARQERQAQPYPPAQSVAGRALGRLEAPKVAMLSVGAIILITVLVVIGLKWPWGNNGDNPTERETPPGIVTPTPTVTPARPCEGLTVAQIERAAEEVVGRVSDDTAIYVFPSDRIHVTRIKETVEQNCHSRTLGVAVQKLRQAQSQLKTWSDNQIDPDLLEYATLAELRGGASDPLETARRIAPQLIAINHLLKDRNADATLLSLAAYQMGPPGRGEHPILERMRRAKINHQTERNVWDLHRKGGLTEAEYGFVIRFLAVGIMAHEPKKYGLDVTF